MRVLQEDTLPKLVGQDVAPMLALLQDLFVQSTAQIDANLVSLVNYSDYFHVTFAFTASADGLPERVDSAPGP